MKQQKTLTVAVALLILLLATGSLWAKQTGPHGGEMLQTKAIVGQPYLELVIKKQGDKKELHVYGVRDGKEVNLTSSGYGGMTLKTGGMELALDFYKVVADGHINNASDRIEHYMATAKFPDSPDVEIEVTVAFPSKMGTDTVVFRPYR